MSDTKKYAETLLSMSTDFLTGGLNEEVYINNLGMFAKNLGAMYDSKSDTLLHIKRVSELLTLACGELIERARVHDNSKLSDREKLLFDRMTPKLKGLTYGSEEYKAALAELKPALDNHYKENSHHPEHYENGVNGMNLFDIMEMFFDWKAASERHGDGDIYKSIDHNEKRFEMSPQLAQIFRNTCEFLNY